MIEEYLRYLETRNIRKVKIKKSGQKQEQTNFICQYAIGHCKVNITLVYINDARLHIKQTFGTEETISCILALRMLTTNQITLVLMSPVSPNILCNA